MYKQQLKIPKDRMLCLLMILLLNSRISCLHPCCMIGMLNVGIWLASATKWHG